MPLFSVSVRSAEGNKKSLEIDLTSTYPNRQAAVDAASAFIPWPGKYDVTIKSKSKTWTAQIAK